MQQDPNIKALARRLVQLTLDDEGQVSEGKVGEVLTALRNKPPRHHKAVLKEFLAQVTKTIANSQAMIEYAGEPSTDAIASIEKQLTESYGRTIKAVTKENPSLIAGLKISIADDVYDASVAGQLKTLSSKVN